eukprot:CAMPEP_0172765046 /NCGR_PEP_ID=MMETSP1074-20121228/178507_1 /TAXON_ID=2916 /ORGANISM="Ceratium fusus, Strain PA161109" /LENGTH=81 /DNA_ID=CAMNT_0013599923 /DNA_START=3 /DNA_END=245 /DNA_ORIENTATION=+
MTLSTTRFMKRASLPRMLLESIDCFLPVSFSKSLMYFGVAGRFPGLGKMVRLPGLDDVAVVFALAPFVESGEMLGSLSAMF